MIFNDRKRQPWMLLLMRKNVIVQHFSWLHDRVNHVALHVVETETLPNIYFNDKEASKRSRNGSVYGSSIFSLQEQIPPTYDIIRPSIHLSSTNLFLFALFLFFFGRWRGGKGSISYLSNACQLSLPLQHHHTPLPTSLSLWDDAGIKDLFYQSISVNHWKSVLFYVSINTMVLLLTVYVAISVRAVQGISHRKKVSLKLCPINYLW